MTKGKAPAVWNDKRCDQAYKLALLGATDKIMADVMGVHVTTIDYWKRKNKGGFLDALTKGKVAADAKVAECFFLNCIDRYVDDEIYHVVAGRVVKTKTKTFVRGDKWAQKQWLATRQRGLWTEITKTENVQTNININKFDFSGLSTKELELVKKLQIQEIKELSENAGSN